MTNEQSTFECATSIWGCIKNILSELKAKGAIVEEPTTRDYGMRDFTIVFLKGMSV